MPLVMGRWKVVLEAKPGVKGEEKRICSRCGGEESREIPAKPATNPFKDVSKSEYYYDAVLWAVGAGVTSGTSKNQFSPDNPCTRGQVVSFLYRALN